MEPLEVVDPLEVRMKLCHCLKARSRTRRRRSGEKSPTTTPYNDSGKKDTAANVGHVSSQINAADESIGTKQTASVVVGEAPVDAKDSQTEAMPTLAQESAGTGNSHTVPTSVADTDVGNATSGGEALLTESFSSQLGDHVSPHIGSNFWDEAGIDWDDPFKGFNDYFPNSSKFS